MSILDETKKKMDDALAAVGRDFVTVRTGKAVPAILDAVRVRAYGGQVPLNQVATVTAPDASLLLVQPFDPSLIGEIEKAVLSSGLGLNPSSDGSVVRVPVPPLNEERRREYVRLLYKMAEQGRISIRHARQAANDRVRSRTLSHEIGEDEGHRLRGRVQKLTDEYVRKIEDLLNRKEREVMEI